MLAHAPPRRHHFVFTLSILAIALLSACVQEGARVKTGSMTTHDLFFPMDEFYSAENRPLPKLEPIDGATMPQPYQRLLVHSGDMTPTLEQFHRQRISLKLFDKRLGDDGWYSRRVALTLDSSGRPVEFGAIRINLNLFSAIARQHILEGKRPLGTILNEDGILHSSKPVIFFRVQSDDLINETLSLTGMHTLYGRRNVLSDEKGRVLAEVLEILPPTMAR